MPDVGEQFRELVELMAFMRGPSGCAWDREQSLESFLEHLPEETGEVLEALEKRDYANLREELGDVLWNLVFMAQIASEEGLFTMSDVLGELNGKIVRRHPHVFGGENLSDPKEILARWKEIKKGERAESDHK